MNTYKVEGDALVESDVPAVVLSHLSNAARLRVIAAEAEVALRFTTADLATNPLVRGPLERILALASSV